jgi:hypothetical protein
MNQELLLVAVCGFIAGYTLKTILYSWTTFRAGSLFVQKISYKVLELIGSIVYKVSYVEQVCIKMVEDSGDPEEAKKIRINFEHQFEDWKGELLNDYVKNYPAEYQWHVEFDDWKGMMEELTHIYKEKKE